MHIYKILLILLTSTFAIELTTGELVLSKLFESCLNSKGVSTSGFSYVQRNNSVKYQELNYQWNFCRANITPLGYFLPNGRNDVQKAIKCARKVGIRVVAKSGGHSYTKYSFGDSHSVVIDLRRISKVSIDAQAMEVTVGAGTLIGQLDWTLWTNGKFGISGPTCPTTGVAGVTLGGGFGLWSKKFGLMIDNVISMEFVDPKGKFLVLNETSNPDLFWAMRGAGGGNFGIVTQFTFKIFNASAMYRNYFSFTYEVGNFTRVFGAFQKFATETQDGATVVSFLGHNRSLGISVRDPNLTMNDLKNKFADLELPVEYIKISSQLLQRNFIEEVIAGSTPRVANTFQLGQVRRTHMEPQYYRAKSYFLHKILTANEIEDLKPLFLEIPPDVIVQILGEGGAINRISRTATAFVHRSILFGIQVCIYSDNKIVDEWVRKFDQIITQVVGSKESYQNYVDEELIQNSEYLKRYYGENLARLVKIKGEIDPDNYFNFPMSIPLEIPSKQIQNNDVNLPT